MEQYKTIETIKRLDNLSSVSELTEEENFLRLIMK